MNADMNAGPVSRWAVMLVLVNAIAVTTLVGGEALLFAVALDWSLAGLFYLPPAIYLPLGAVLVGLAGWASVMVFRNALAVERGLLRDDSETGTG